jgi:hypothetical protein
MKFRRFILDTKLIILFCAVGVLEATLFLLISVHLQIC